MTYTDELEGWRLDQNSDGTWTALLGGNFAVTHDGRIRLFTDEKTAHAFLLQQKRIHDRPMASEQHV